MKKVEAWKARHIYVNCERNDRVDIKCGGPPILGFDFYIDPKQKKMMIKFIEKCLNENCRPLMSINTGELRVVETVWTKEMIAESIKKGY